MQDYKHKNESLTGAVASDLILKLFDGRTEVPRRVIYEKVIEFHLSHEGLRPRSESSDPVLNGLDRLRGEGKADNPKRGFGNINSAGVNKGDTMRVERSGRITRRDLQSMTREELHDYAVQFKERLWRVEAAEHGEDSPQAESVREMSVESIKAALLVEPV